jgi:hypothetical protein
LAAKKISALTGYASPISTDVFPIVDVTTAETKKITLANVQTYLQNNLTGFLKTAGVSGGQSANGGTDASDNLTFNSTANATKGNIILGSTDGDVFDEVNNRFTVGVGATENTATVNGVSVCSRRRGG